MDIIQMSTHTTPEPADNAAGNKSVRMNVVWIRSTENGFQPGVDLTAGPTNAPIPAAPQRYVRTATCTPLSTSSQCEAGASFHPVAGGYGARLSQLGDFNGDGALDIVTLVQTTDADTDPNAWARLQQFLGEPVSPDVVTRIEGGPLMPAIDVSYAFAGPESANNFYSVSAAFDSTGNPRICNPSPCDFGQTYLQGKLGWVVQQHSVEAGNFADPQPIHHVYRYTYDTGRVDLRGRGFLGVDERQRTLTNDENTQIFERQILTFDHSLQSRVFQGGPGKYQYASVGPPVRERIITPILPGTLSAVDVRHSRELAPRGGGGGFGFDLNRLTTTTDQCEIPGRTDILVPHPCGGGGATLISSTHSEQQFDTFGNAVFREKQVAVDGSFLDDSGAFRILNPPPSFSTVARLTGANDADQSRWLINRYPEWSYESDDPTQPDFRQRSISQNGLIDYFAQRVETKDVTFGSGGAATPESDAVSDFVHTTSYERDIRLGTITAVSECGTIAPCDPATSRRTSFGFDSHDADRIFYSTTTNTLGQVRTVWPHATLGVPYAVSDENGVQTTFHFDVLGRIQDVSRPGGGEESFTYENDVLPNGNRSRFWTMSHYGSAISEVRSSYNPLGLVDTEVHRGFNAENTRTFVYDRFGREISESLPRSQTGGVALTVDFQRDGLGRIIQTSRPGETAQAPRFFSLRTYVGRTETRTTECVGAPTPCRGGRGVSYNAQRDSKGRVTTLSTADDKGNSVSTQTGYWHFDLPSHITHPKLPTAPGNESGAWRNRRHSSTTISWGAGRL